MTHSTIYPVYGIAHIQQIAKLQIRSTLLEVSINSNNTASYYKVRKTYGGVAQQLCPPHKDAGSGRLLLIFKTFCHFML